MLITLVHKRKQQRRSQVKESSNQCGVDSSYCAHAMTKAYFLIMHATVEVPQDMELQNCLQPAWLEWQTQNKRKWFLQKPLPFGKRQYFWYPTLRLKECAWHENWKKGTVRN